MPCFQIRFACCVISAITAAGIVAFADPANAVPIGRHAPVVSIGAAALHGVPLRIAPGVANG